MVTYSVTNFDASVSALTGLLDYSVVETGQISELLAQHWSAPAVSGSRYCITRPLSGADFYLRFIETPATDGYAPLKTFGWNATEFLIQDVHALALELQDSAYTIIGGPRDLLEDGTVIALQVRGPSDEIFYLTELNSAQFHSDYGIAQTKVDRAFIAVLGVSDHACALDYYRPASTGITTSRKLTIRVLANAHQLDPMVTEFDLASVMLGGQFRIEVDGYPQSASTRPCLEKHLPPGMCMVSFTTDSLADLPLKFTSTEFKKPSQAPYCGRPTAMTKGASGELIEIIESTKLDVM